MINFPICSKKKSNPNLQDSPHLVKTGWPLSETSEKLAIFLRFFPRYCMSPYISQTCCTTILKRMQSTNLEYKILNITEKVRLLVKKYWLGDLYETRRKKSPTSIGLVLKNSQFYTWKSPISNHVESFLRFTRNLFNDELNCLLIDLLLLTDWSHVQKSPCCNKSRSRSKI